MKVSIIGLGRTGSQVAFCCLQNGLAETLALVSRDPQKASGEALDLTHANAMTEHQVDVISGDVEVSAKSDIIVMTVSVPYDHENEDRSTMLQGNYSIFKDLIPQLSKLSPEAIFIIISNPVDAMTYLTLKLSGFPSERVIGTGTLVDSARFRRLLSQKLAIHPDDIRAYILGEHGDRQFPLLSHADSGVVPVKDDDLLAACFEKTRQSGYEIVSRKGYTSHAIAVSTSMIIECIRDNGQHTLPVSVLVNDYYGVDDVCLSVPVVVGRSGVQQFLNPELSDQEIDWLQKSAAAVKANLAELDQE